MLNFCVIYQIRRTRQWCVQWFESDEKALIAYRMAKAATLGDDPEFMSAAITTVKETSRADGYVPFQLSE